MSKNEDKFNSRSVILYVIVIMTPITGLLVVMYFNGHREFVINIFYSSLAIILFGPIINRTGIYKLLTSHLLQRQHNKQEQIYEDMSKKIRHEEHALRQRRQRVKDPNLPKKTGDQPMNFIKMFSVDILKSIAGRSRGIHNKMINWTATGCHHFSGAKIAPSSSGKLSWRYTQGDR